MLRDTFLYFENGLFIRAKGFGSPKTVVGEAVFNTSLSGYQEIITDPSYAGQFIVFTMPEIGITGFNEFDYESRGVFAKAVIMRRANAFFSNFRGQENIISFFEKHNILGICNIDTRGIVKIIRDKGVLNLVASSEISQKDKLVQILSESKSLQDIDFIKEVSTKSAYLHTQGIFDFNTFSYTQMKTQASTQDKQGNTKRIIAIDFGIKKSILNELCSLGLEVEVLPYDFKAQDIIKRYVSREIGGVFLSNGPGDPLVLKEIIQELRELIKAKIPMFGICLGHQLLSIAHGYDTFKLKFGQHGANHPVKNVLTSELEITSQNHNYSVPESIEEVALITHRNLFDNTIEGVRYKDSPIFSVQHHPEASPGPKEASRIFQDFASIIAPNSEDINI